ncbi:MAG: GHKL domain-containing protein [Lachnospiraceae bacterium]|nr:GHKL domain-containing protein [Lachnospiraceae bacterium]
MLSIYILSDVIHYFKIIIVCHAMVRFEHRSFQYLWISYLLSLASMILCSFLSYHSTKGYVKVAIALIAIGIALFICFEERIEKLLIATIWLYLIMSILDTMTIILMEVLCLAYAIDETEIVSLGGAILSFLIVAVFAMFYAKKYKRGIASIGMKNIFLFSLLAFVDSVVIIAMSIGVRIESFTGYKVLYLAAFMLAIIGIFIQLGAVIVLFMQKDVLKEKELIARKYLNEQSEHYEYLKKREHETKKFRHDLLNHMKILISFAEQEKYDELSRYLNSMQEKTANFGTKITVRNGIVDAILNQYSVKAKKENINMRVKGTFPSHCKIEDYDLCTIFSNVLSNAFEAAEKTEERNVFVDCRYNEDKLAVVIRNSCSNAEEKIGLKTTKEDKNYHGFGMENIKECVDKYDGYMDITIEDGMFVLRIMLTEIECKM